MKSNEWFTPSKYIEAAREVMGGIDLDPASCALANETVKAARYYTKEENGLMQPWNARSLWLNPPFGRVHPELIGGKQSLQQCFAEKLWREYHSGNVEQACLLSLSMVKKWSLPYWDYLAGIIYDRTHYTNPDGSELSFSFGIIIFYLGQHEQRFIDVFSRFGIVARRVSPAKERPVTPELWTVYQEPRHDAILVSQTRHMSKQASCQALDRLTGTQKEGIL